MKSKVQKLRDLGFDLSERVPFQGWTVKCSQCEALVINGYPAHEQGCPHQTEKRDDR
jgi:hypothetical protein